MLNFSARREAIEALEAALSRHDAMRAPVMAASECLFDRRERAARVVVGPVETYLSALAESPKDFDKTVTEFRAEADGFPEHVEQGQVRHRSVKQGRRSSRSNWHAGRCRGRSVRTVGRSRSRDDHGCWLRLNGGLR